MQIADTILELEISPQLLIKEILEMGSIHSRS